ncbi:hypothetical protein B9Q11_03200, partial [Candidatus Marsarchaeota G2 archaeon ECH_B_SAG-F08]
MKIKLKRVYAQPSQDDGYRILVDRLWPRGFSREMLKIDQWMREVAPSDALRKWFSHDPKKWEDFLKRYKKELNTNEAFQKLVELVKNKETVTLVYSA